LVEWHTYKKVEKQNIELKRGFNEMIPSELLKEFDETELEVCFKILYSG
jgi:hypothetical protein